MPLWVEVWKEPNAETTLERPKTAGGGGAFCSDKTREGLTSTCGSEGNSDLVANS